MNDTTRFVGPFDRVLYLKSLEPLRGLSTSQLVPLARLAIERQFRAGDILVQDESLLRRFYMIVEGTVRAEKHGVTQLPSHAGEAVGFLQWLAGDSEGMLAVADTDVVALEFWGPSVMEIWEDHFPMLRSAIQNMSQRTLEILKSTTDGGYKSPWQERGVQAPEGEPDLIQGLVLIRKSPIFATASLEALANIAAGQIYQTFDAGTVLWEPGATADHMQLILSGDVHCTFDEGRRQFTAGAGYPLGNVETIAQMPRWYRAECITPVRAMRSDSIRIFDTMEDHFDVAQKLLMALAQNILRYLEQDASNNTIEQAS